MELLLNIVWLSIAAGTLLAYIRMLPGDLRQLRLGFGALCCFSALLLPPVSITDDLHFQASGTVENSGTQWLVTADVDPGTGSLVWAVTSLLVVSSPLRRKSLRTVVNPSASSALCWAESETSPDSPYHCSIPGRAPPSVLA